MLHAQQASPFVCMLSRLSGMQTIFAPVTPSKPDLQATQQVELALVADDAIEVETQRLEHRLGHRFHLLRHIVLAIERMLDVAKRFGPRGRHDITDEPSLRLRGFSRGRDVWRGSGRVVLGRLA